MPRYKETTITNNNSVDLTANFTSTTAGGVDYSYTQSSNLRMFLRFGEAVTNLASYPSNDTITIEYKNSPTFGSTTYGSRALSYFDAAEDGSNDKSVTVTFSGANSPEDNITSFGDGSADSPFSVSMWIKYESTPTSGDRYLVNKGRDSGGVDQEFHLIYNDDGNKIYVRLYDDSTSAVVVKTFNSIDLSSDGDWHHVVLTYDGFDSAPASDNHITVYIDGQDIESNADIRNNGGGSYTSMEPISDELHVAAKYDETTPVDGLFAEFAIWGAELSSNDVKAIYYAQFDALETSIEYNSGYTNLSPRIQQRSLDNRPGCYPTKHRMGDKDRSGKGNIFYEDLPIQFGSRIYDNFESIKTVGGFADSTNFDNKKWSVSSGLSIKTERIVNQEGEIETTNCAVFSGPGTGGKRYIQSYEKILNPTRFYFELIQGPYNQTTGGLGLQASFPSDDYGIKVQISTDSSFTSPITIATYRSNAVQKDFYGVPSDSPMPQKRRKRITLSTKDFAGLSESYYFRFVQESYISISTNWAIANIEIEYANQNIKYPLLLNHTSGHDKFITASLSTPHLIPDLSGIGRAVKGISDINNPFQDFSESVSAFDETFVIENESNSFFNEGLDPDVYPGFTSPARSKTKFTIDLSPREETTFGYTSFGDGSGWNNDETEPEQFLMVYWNQTNKKWNTIGAKGVGGNHTASPTFNEYLTGTLRQAAAGFGPTGYLFTGSYMYDSDALALYGKPIDTFSFPYGNQYVATASNYILAKDIGITKPFLFEKAALETNIKFEIPGYNDLSAPTDASGKYGIHTSFNAQQSLRDGDPLYDEDLSIRKFSFFMLRQLEENVEVHEERIQVYSQRTSFVPTYEQLEYIEKSVLAVNSGSTRELITFGQINLICSASTSRTPPSSLPNVSDIGFKPEIKDILDSEFANKNTNIIIEDWDHGATLSLTGSYNINFEVKNTAPYESTNQFDLGSDIPGLIARNKIGGRGYNRGQNSRAIVNGILGSDETKQFIAECKIGAGPGRITFPITKKDNIEKTSPYLILPNDKLILGWQYPLAIDLQKALPMPSDSAFNSMTLFGKSKLHLYGSQVVENKEYHETTNQNLTSCAVYEHIIGDEKIVDQWQVAYRGELTGSIHGQNLFRGPGSNTYFASYNDEAYDNARGYDYVWDGASSQVGERGDNYRISSFAKIIPKKRIGILAFTSNRKFLSDNLLKPYYESISVPNPQASADAESLKNYPFYNSYETKLIRARDIDRIYEDSRKSKGEYYDDSYYGTYGEPKGEDFNPSNASLQAYGEENIRKWYLDLMPKYRFSTKHFGHYADMFQQGKDSKFKVVPRQGFTTGYDIVVNSRAPVKALFVEKTIEENGKINYEEKPIDYFTNFFYFQSSNLNQFMTSSIPFIDDNTVRNRSYVATEFIGFNSISPVDLLS